MVLLPAIGEEWARKFGIIDGADEDAPLLARIRGIPVRPVFIMGVHRSGTTFLYESVARAFPLAPLTAYHIVFYRRLLSRSARGVQGEDRALLEEYFRQHGAQTREIDGIELGHGTVEEYGWLLQRYGGGVRLEASTAGLFAEACRKLLHLRPDCATVVMKSPWDAARGPEILTLFPDSRFVYIERDPVETFNSRFKTEVLLAAGPSPYLDLLVQGFPFARSVLAVERALYRAIGAAAFRRLMARRLLGNVPREIAAMKESMKRLPAEVWCRVTYRDLIERPRDTLDRIGAFLDLAPRPEAAFIQSRPRSATREREVQAALPTLEQRLQRLGLSQSPR